MKALRAAPAAMGRGTARPGNTTAEPPKTPEKRGIAGSTIMAVLIALVFIGIVTAAMVRNTGSQSSASVGYGTMQTMAVTTSSGIIATESYFFNANNLSNLQAKMDALLNAENSDKGSKKPFILGGVGGDKKKEKLAADQYFSSRVSGFDEDNKNPKYMWFEVNAGNREGGRNLKNAFAYYNIDNTYNQITVESEEFGGTNSFTASENGTLKAGNSDATFHGHVTLEHGLHIQGETSVSFVKDAKGEGSLYVKDKSEIKNGQPVTFEVDAYFDDTVLIQNTPTNYEMFQKNVGFNKDFFAHDKTINFGGHLWFNGDLKNHTSYNTSGKLVSTGTNKNFYYTDKINMKTDAMCGVNKETCKHPGDHKVTFSTQILDFQNVGTNPDGPAAYLGANIDNIPKLMRDYNGDKKGMTTIEERKEPDIAVTNIAEGKKFIEIHSGNMWSILDGASSLSGEALQAFYDKTKDDDDYKDNYDNGHLLLRIPPDLVLSANGGGVFNGKVIFDVEGSLNANGNFYSSDSAASTLIYTGKTGTLNQFGLADGGTFRGLVYVDSSNSKDHTFSWGNESKIQGAVIIKGGNLTWNTNSKKMDIYRNDDVLKNYAFLKGVDSEGKKKTTVNDIHRGIKLSACGYYFY